MRYVRKEQSKFGMQARFLSNQIAREAPELGIYQPGARADPDAPSRIQDEQLVLVPPTMIQSGLCVSDETLSMASGYSENSN